MFELLMLLIIPSEIEPTKFGIKYLLKERFVDYQTCEKYGIVWVCLDHNSKSEIPDLPEYDDGNYRKINFFEKETTKTNVLRMIMGTLDNTHFPWVHGGILGSKGKINQSKNNCNSKIFISLLRTHSFFLKKNSKKIILKEYN